MKLILLGAPGAGKGTQAEIISKKFGIPTISTGNILREAMKNGTPVGLKAKEYVESGRLVPDEIIIGIIGERLTNDDCKDGYILDGVPRTISQAEALEKAGIVFDFVVSIEISDEEIEERMSGRRVCSSCGATYNVTSNPPKKADICDSCGGGLIRRKDDDPETVRSRLKVYHTETEPLKDFYMKRGKLRSINARPTIEANTKAIMEALAIS